MATPDIIELKPLQNQFRDRTFTPKTPSQVTNVGVDTDAEKTLGAVHKENFFKLIFQILSNGANPIDVFFYGAAQDDIIGTDDPHNPPPDDTSNEWTLLPNGDVIGTVGGSNDARIITDNWTWIMIRIARTNSGQDGQLTLNIRGE